MGNYLHKSLAVLTFAASIMIGKESYSQFPNQEFYQHFSPEQQSTPTRYDYSFNPRPDSVPSKFEKRLAKEFKLKSFGTQVPAEKNMTKYGVLISGDNEARFSYDLSLAYNIMLESGFKKENIYILDQYGIEESIYPSDNIATKENIFKLLSHLERIIDEDDMLVMHISDHGQKVLDTRHISADDADDVKREYHRLKTYNLEWDYIETLFPDKYKFFTAIVLPGENYNENDYINEIEFEQAMSKIKPGLGIVTATLCFGYDIINKLDKDRFIGISASQKDKVSHITLNDSFIGFFYDGFRNKPEADLNKDDFISIEEAFFYGQKKCTYSNSSQDEPQIVTNLDIKKISLKD